MNYDLRIVLDKMAKRGESCTPTMEYQQGGSFGRGSWHLRRERMEQW